MHIQDFNKPAQPVAPSGTEAAAPAPDAASGASGPMSREQTEISLLKKRIEHLELVVETARSLMTSNQEKLLRRLHDLPQELVALTAALHRIGGEEAVESSATHGPGRRAA